MRILTTIDSITSVKSVVSSYFNTDYNNIFNVIDKIQFEWWLSSVTKEEYLKANVLKIVDMIIQVIPDIKGSMIRDDNLKEIELIIVDNDILTTEMKSVLIDYIYELSLGSLVVRFEDTYIGTKFDMCFIYDYKKFIEDVSIDGVIGTTVVVPHEEDIDVVGDILKNVCELVIVPHHAWVEERN